jgi:5-enolpyruvylshikimate-3-phosphate synthase
MTALVAGLAAEGETVVSDGECVGVSYPAFHDQLRAYL